MLVNISKVNVDEMRHTGSVSDTTGPKQAERDESELTIDEIARDAELPVSTIRLYQNKGLLAPPIKRGRVGYYGQDHRDRLRLIAHLQTRGFSLAAIKESLDSWNAGRSLDHLLGVGAVAPTLERAPIRLTLTELVERFEGVGLSQAEMQRAVATGLVELDGTDVVVKHEAFAEIGPAVAKLGVPVAEILDEYDALAMAVDEIAQRFRAVFEQHMWQPFVERGLPEGEIGALTNDVGQLTELATSVVTVELQERFAAFAAEYVTRAQAAATDNG